MNYPDSVLCSAHLLRGWGSSLRNVVSHAYLLVNQIGLLWVQFRQIGRLALEFSTNVFGYREPLFSVQGRIVG